MHDGVDGRTCTVLVLTDAERQREENQALARRETPCGGLQIQILDLHGIGLPCRSRSGTGDRRLGESATNHAETDAWHEQRLLNETKSQAVAAVQRRNGGVSHIDGVDLLTV